MLLSWFWIVVGHSILFVIQVAGRSMCKYADQLLPVIIHMLEDGSSTQKREVALRTLGQVVASTGMVVEPYHKFPNLLSTLLDLLFTEPELTVRKEVRMLTVGNSLLNNLL